MRSSGSTPADPMGVADAFRPGSTLYAEISREGRRDSVAIEEPLEIRVDGEPLSVTMRTPGHDEELALGFLFGEGLIDGAARRGPRRRPRREHGRGRRGRCRATPAAAASTRRSSCGVCGKGALEEVAVASADGRRRRAAGRRATLLAALPERLDQPAFERTGGVHATGLFDARGRAAARPRGRRPPQRDGQGRRARAARRPRSAARRAALRQRPALFRAGPEGGGRGLRRSWSGSAPPARWRSSWPPTAG